MLIDKKQAMLLVKQVHSTKFSSIREHSLKFEMRYRMTKEKTFFNIIHLFSQKYLNSVENIISSRDKIFYNEISESFEYGKLTKKNFYEVKI